MTVDVVFMAWNRLEFTKASFSALASNTDWDRVRRLVVYDDGSEDGTRDWLEAALADFPADVVFRAERFGSPVSLMAVYLRRDDPAEVFAKIDSDVAVPPGWLGEMLAVLDRNPSVELLGMEAGMTRVAGRDGAPFDGVRTVEPSSHIGGVGLMRRSAFESRAGLAADGRNGFTEWQHTHRPARGWIAPDLPVVLLDRLPFDPWRSLSAEYVERGWQRPWPSWDPVWMRWAWEWFSTEGGTE